MAGNAGDFKHILLSGMNEEWTRLLKDELDKDYFNNICDRLKKDYVEKVIYPPADEIFRAFTLTPPERVKVVILGQDPYHNPREANGLAFSVKKGVKIPRSLKNIYKELEAEYSCYMPDNGCLEKWAKQGVLLLNSTLTVDGGVGANSQKDIGWQTFTDEVIKRIELFDSPIVYMLWGSYARKKGSIVNNPKHLVLKSAHPSPLSARRGFFGCGHFKKCNEFLENNGLDPIDWQIEDILEDNDGE